MNLLDSLNPTVATYTGRKDCRLRISAKAKTKEEAKALILPMVDRCVDCIGEQYIDFIKEDDEDTF